MSLEQGNQRPECRWTGIPIFDVWRKEGRETYIVSFTAQLPEGLDVEPGTFIPSRVQGDAHGIFLEQRRETLVHSQVLVTFYVKKLLKKERRDNYLLQINVRISFFLKNKSLE